MTPPPSLQDLIDTVRQDSPSEDPLDQLATASAAVGQLEATSDALLGHFVDRCRRGGQSWSQISAALGVSKQAVHKRFSGSIADRLIESHHPPTFERFTSRARAVLVAADAGASAGASTTPAGDRLAWSAPARDTLRNALVEALELGHNYIGTEHILL